MQGLMKVTALLALLATNCATNRSSGKKAVTDYTTAAAGNTACLQVNPHSFQGSFLATTETCMSHDPVEGNA